MADPPIFRTAALERLSSPERLDELMQVTRPRAWLALAALALMVVAAIAWSFLGQISSHIAGQGILIRAGGLTPVVTTLGGSVVSLHARPGELIGRGAPVLAVETGTGRQVVVSPIAGRLLELRVQAGLRVATGTTVALLEPAASPLQAVAYVAPLQGKSVRAGMTALLLPATVRAEDAGHLLGVVRTVSAFPVTQERMTATLGTRELVERFAAGGPPYEVHIDLLPHPDIAGAHRWSSPRTAPVESGTLCAVSIVARTQRPIDLVIPRRAPPAGAPAQ